MDSEVPEGDLRALHKTTPPSHPSYHLSAHNESHSLDLCKARPWRGTSTASSGEVQSAAVCQVNCIYLCTKLGHIFKFQPSLSAPDPSQVTLTAETECSYISWPRKNLHLLLTKERYISRLFSVLLGYDISEKLYALNDKLFAKFGLRFDIRLPSLYHVLGPAAPGAGPEPEKAGEDVRGPAACPPQALHVSAQQTPPRSPAPLTTDSPAPPPGVRMSRPDSGVLGEDSASLVLEDFEEVSGSESFMDYKSDGEYMR